MKEEQKIQIPSILDMPNYSQGGRSQFSNKESEKQMQKQSNAKRSKFFTLNQQEQEDQDDEEEDYESDIKSSLLEDQKEDAPIFGQSLKGSINSDMKILDRHFQNGSMKQDNVNLASNKFGDGSMRNPSSYYDEMAHQDVSEDRRSDILDVQKIMCPKFKF